VNQRIRTSGLIATFLALAILLQPLSPIANSVPGGVAYSGDTRSVPIFAVMQAGGRQPTQVISSGFLYSSRIVFTAGVQDRIFDQAKGGIYVGKPGSKSTDTSGRIKVIKAFYPNSGEAELNDFVIFVLERELAKVEPFPLLQVGQEANVREASVRGYGEYQDRCGPGAQGPCPEKPTSEISRQINVNVIPLSQAETLVGYERPQLMGQIILQNTKNAQDGVICRGDVGSPVIGNLGGTGVYLGAASRSMNGKICGAVGVEKVERDKPKVSTSFDGIAGITHIAPVYRYSGVINEAQIFAAQSPTPTPTSSTKSLTPSPTPSTETTETEIKNCWALWEPRRVFEVVRRGNEIQVLLVAEPEETLFRFFRGTMTQNPTKEWIKKYESKKYRICRLYKKESTYSANVIAYKTGPVHNAAPVVTTIVAVETEQDVLFLEASNSNGISLHYRAIGPGTPATKSQKVWCSANSVLPLAGIFNASKAMSNLMLTRYGLFKGGGIPAASVGVATSIVANIVSMGLINKFDTDAGYGAVSGTISFYTNRKEDLPKTLKVGGVTMKLSEVKEQFEKAGKAGKGFFVATVVMTVKDVRDLAAAVGEMTYGLEQKEFQRICERVGW
jgi:hypothetical protein